MPEVRVYLILLPYGGKKNCRFYKRIRYISSKLKKLHYSSQIRSKKVLMQYLWVKGLSLLHFILLIKLINMEIIVLETNNEDQIAELKALVETETSVDVIVIVDNKPINKGFEPESFTISENKYYEDYPISKNGKGKKTKSWEKSKYQ